MENKKTTFYTWMFVLFANIDFIIWLIIMNVVITRQERFLYQGDYIFVIFAVFVSAVPILISDLKGKLKKLLTFGIPILLLATVYLTIVSFDSCGTLGCLIGKSVIAGYIFWGIIAFIIFYFFGKYAKRINTKVILFFVLIEIILFLGGAVLIGYAMYLDSAVSSFDNGEKLEPMEAVKLCESRSSPNCWINIVKANPDMNVCALIKDKYNKYDCLYHGVRGVANSCYSTIDGYIYANINDPVEYKKISDCWREKSKIYPEYNFCLYTPADYIKKCLEFFKTF